MNQAIAPRVLNAANDRPSRAEWAATGLLAGACVVAPLALGATAAWPRFAIEAVIGLAVAIWALATVPTAPTAFLPLACVALLAVQLLPVPDRVLVAISPVSAGAWKIATAEAPDRWGRISVDPATTAAGLRRLLLAVATIVVVADLGRRKPFRHVFTGGLCFVCVAIWTLGLAFPFQRKELILLGFIDCKGPIAKEFWKTPIEPPLATNGSGNLTWVTVGQQRYQSPMWIAADGFGPYLYSNHFAGALTLTLPATLGAWLAWSRRRMPNVVRHAIVAAIFAAAVWTVGVMAMSRAGTAAMMLAALVFGSLTFERLWMRRIASALTVVLLSLVAALSLVTYSGWNGIEQVLPAAWQAQVTALIADSRSVAARVALRMFAASPLFGTGIGTYGALFPRFLRSDFLLHFAHNDYAQWLAETGLVGTSLAVGFLGVLIQRFRCWWKKIVERRQGDPVSAGFWAALAGIGVHTAYDWNLHVPANALLACVVAGLAIASGSPNRTEAHSPHTEPRSWLRPIPGFMLALVCLLAVAILARDAFTAAVERGIRQSLVAARIAKPDDTAPSAEPLLRASLASAERASEWDPANGQLAVLIGLARLHLAAIPAAVSDPFAEREIADGWFARARLRCAAGLGLPERLPEKSAPPPP
jgi:hypothetical protein